MYARWLALGLSVSLIALHGPVGASPPVSEADRIAAEAEALARAGDYSAAAAKFRLAWQADRMRSELFCNIGISQYKAKDLVRAHLLLGQCLEQAALDPTIAESVRTALVSVERVLRASGHAPVRFVVDPATTTLAISELAPDVSFVGSRVVWLAFGTYHLKAHAEGYVDATDTIAMSTPAPRTVTISLRRPVDVRVVRPAPASEPQALVQPSERSQSSKPSWIPAIALTATTAVAAGVAVFSSVQGRASADRAASALDSGAYEEDRSAIQRWNATLVVAGAVAGVAALASGYAWYRALHVEPNVEIRAERATATLTILGRF